MTDVADLIPQSHVNLHDRLLPEVIEPVDRLARSGVTYTVNGRHGLAKATYLVIDLEAEGDVAATLLLEFYARGTTERTIFARIGLLPHVVTRVAFPLSALDGQTLFLPRSPLRLKACVQGKRTNLDEVDRVVVALEPSPAPLRLRIHAQPRLSDRAEDGPACERVLVDPLGQWADRTWPGKTADESELVSNLHAARNATATPTERETDRTAFGGSSTITFPATGHFRLHQDGRRWWLVDPAGGAFFSAGPDCVRPDSTSPILPGTERNFAWLPPEGDSRFSDAWTGKSNISHSIANLIRAFDGNWRSDWAAITVPMLKRYGFNTVANWSDLEFARASGMPYVVPMPHLSTTGKRLFRSLPDVFDPAYGKACATWSRWLQQFSGDANLIGYFLTNEPDWAFGKHNLASEMLEANPGTHTRRALAAFLKERYANDDAAWAAAWDCAGKSIDAVINETWRRAESRSTAAYDDLFAFSRQIVQQWIRGMMEPCRTVLPHHLNLGVRWAWISSDLCYEVAPFCDVFTINNYSNEPPLGQLTEIEKRTGRPVIIGEFHHGSTDRGLPCNGISAVATEAERGTAYRRYVELCAAHPACVGAHYFQYSDQPILGRFDGENYHIGFVDTCFKPHDEFLQAARQTHERMYDVASGQTALTEEKAAPVPSIFF
ncbi:MAG TPA: hypothetical protein VGN72_04535 [Tepidisphaeraceae bacterium]|jgi:hypothetical protein|nr:hypothetical protein [Tepidisphaeraceae bacterium]